jgi:hypothetical protein
MTLLALQQAFLAEIAAADDDVPSAASAPASPGMAIYREAYRSRLLAALETSFERTRQWVGEAAFTAAACHYILTTPPRGWTLDTYGHDFAGTLAELFRNDPEVAELAWLEWHLQQAFAARDLPILRAEDLASRGYGEADWANLRFTMAAGFACRWVATAAPEIWPRLEDSVTADLAAADPAASSTTPRLACVWRSGFRATFQIAAADEAVLIEQLAHGSTFGAIAALTSPERLGQLLAGWLTLGVFSAATTA